MERHLTEITSSQQKMLKRLGKKGAVDSETFNTPLYAKFEHHLKDIKEWLSEQAYIEVCYVSYNDMIDNPTKVAEQVNVFLGNKLDNNKMVAVVDKTLYREQARVAV
jgi:protein involved in ribonucleotide reduction